MVTEAIDTGCSHGMASIYYAVSIENDCFVVREQCSNENNLPVSISFEISQKNIWK